MHACMILAAVQRYRPVHNHLLVSSHVFRALATRCHGLTSNCGNDAGCNRSVYLTQLGLCVGGE